jgi:hypothetical protein
MLELFFSDANEQPVSLKCVHIYVHVVEQGFEVCTYLYMYLNKDMTQGRCGTEHMRDTNSESRQWGRG